MAAIEKPKIISVVREGNSVRRDWTTADERIEGVWELTLECLAWQGEGDAEPRLQRSVVRVLRPRR